MKKRNIALFTLLGTLSLSASIIFAVNNNKSAYTEASATVSNLISGKFVRVTSASELDAGGSFIFVADNGYALSDVWGNPGYVYGQTDGVAFSNQGFVALYNSPASAFGVEKVGDNYAFFTSMKVTGEFKNKVYLAYNDRQYSGEFNAVGYFYGDRTGVATEIRGNDASWSFTYDAENGNHLTHVGQGGNLGFTFGYAPRFCRNDNDHRVEIYKEVVDAAYTISVVDGKEPTITEYSNGDEINLSGLEIDFHSSYHNGTYAYDDHRHLFSCEKYASGSGSRNLEVTFMNMFTFTVEITVNRAEYYASQVTSPLADYRGQYMLVSDYGPAFNGDDFSKVSTSPGPNNKLKVGHSNEEEVKFIVEKEDENFYLKNYEGKYLSFQGGFNYINTKTFPVTFEYDQGGIRVKGGGQYLNFDNDELYFCLGGKNTENHEPVFLYKYDYTNEVVNALENFANGFISATMVCDPQGMSNNITDGIWSAQASAFGGLDPFAQAELINKAYNPGHTEDDAVAQAVERYDYIVSKYSNSDFIGRSTYGTLQNQKSDITINNIYKNNVDMANVIIICSVAFLSGLLIYSFIRLKKESIK